MNKNILMIIVCTLAFFACTNEADLKLADNIQTVDIEGMIVENQNGTLAFESESQLKMALDKLSEVSIPEGGGVPIRAKVISSDKKGFHSLYDVFIEALTEAESYYEREGGYEEFKEKYAMLYFPEEGDDYSAYLPIGDDNLAKIADTNGNVIVGGEIRSLKDVNSYQQLKELGKTPPEDGGVDLRALTGTNGIAEEKYNDRKIWVKTYKRFERVGAIGGHPVLWVEVCFRNKGPFGIWYNNTSYTEIRNLRIPYLSWSKYGENGVSSHDYVFPIDPYMDGIVHKYPAIYGTMNIFYRGFGEGKILTLTVDYDGGNWLPGF